MPVNNASLIAAALQRMGMSAIRDPSVPIYEDQGQTSDDGWPDSSLYDSQYGRFIPPYTRTPQTRNETLNDVYNQIKAENAAVEQRRQIRRLLEWRHERPDPVTWRGTEPGYNDDTINVYPDSQGIPFNTGVDEREQAFNKYMGTGKYPWPVQPGGPTGWPNAKWYPNDDLQGLRGLQTPVPNPGPSYIPPNVPTPPTPSEIAGRGPDQNYVSGEPNTPATSSAFPPSYWNKRKADIANIAGGRDTLGAGFAPSFSATNPASKDKRNIELNNGVDWNSKPDYGPSAKDDSKKVNSIWKLLFGSGRKPEETPSKLPSAKKAVTPFLNTLERSSSVWNPVAGLIQDKSNTTDFGRLLFGSGRRPQAPKPKSVEPKVSKPITRSSSSSKPKSDYGLTPSNRSYMSSSSRNVAPRRTSPPPPPIYRPPTQIVDVVDETPYSPPPVYKPPVQRRFGGY